MGSKVMVTRIRVGSSAARELAASRPDATNKKFIDRLVEFVKAFARSSKSRAAWILPAAQGASDAELAALQQRLAEDRLMAGRTAAFVAMYGSW